MNQNPRPSDALGAPGDQTTAVSAKGNTTFSSDTTVESKTFSSTTGGENAVLVVDGGVVLLESPTITKSGDESSENSDFYGTNAAVLATGGTLTIQGGSITTSGAHANGVFAYGDSLINVINTKITTTSNNSGGVMVAGEGSLSVSNATIETSGNSSAAIRSDRGGGTLSVSGGSYKTTGIGSPAIYSTAFISVEDAVLHSTASEGVVIEGGNSVSLKNTTLTDSNTSLNGNSETYKNIFIYQSMSGDASEGIGSFSAYNSTITTDHGDTFYVTNTTAEIFLENNQFTNNDETSAFLRAEGAKWGTAGQNGGDVELTLTNQVVEGDIILDNLSSLTLTMDGSHYMGAINTSNAAKSVSVTLSADSNLILTGNTYLTSLENADSTNKNIYSNGYKLYVGETEVAVNGSEAPELPEVDIVPIATGDTCETEDCEETIVISENAIINPIPFIVGGAAFAILVAAIVALIIYNKKKTKLPPTPPSAPSAPDFSALGDSATTTPPPAPTASALPSSTPEKTPPTPPPAV
ncbi:hypothetical protein IJH27_00350 [Candidatus Saccharibacteria bacterium]|nr:hypothetical protein [Candidatus Saccharibacteria bacterium]